MTMQLELIPTTAATPAPPTTRASALHKAPPIAPAPTHGDCSAPLAPGLAAMVEGVSGQWVVAQPFPGGEQRYTLWGPNGWHIAPRCKITPLTDRPNPQALKDLASNALHCLVAGLGGDEVGRLLEKVKSYEQIEVKP